MADGREQQLHVQRRELHPFRPDHRVELCRRLTRCRRSGSRPHNFTASMGITPAARFRSHRKPERISSMARFWEFLRNDKLNARSFFQTRRAQTRQNQFGGRRRRPASRRTGCSSSAIISASRTGPRPGRRRRSFPPPRSAPAISRACRSSKNPTDPTYRPADAGCLRPSLRRRQHRQSELHQPGRTKRFWTNIVPRRRPIACFVSTPSRPATTATWPGLTFSQAASTTCTAIFIAIRTRLTSNTGYIKKFTAGHTRIRTNYSVTSTYIVSQPALIHELLTTSCSATILRRSEQG